MRIPIIGLVAAILVLPLLPEPADAFLDAPVLKAGASGQGKQMIYITAGPSGLPYGFTLRWADEAFIANGRQWGDQTLPGEGRASFTGAPTLNTFYDSYLRFRLGPHEWTAVEIGDLLQETGVEGTVDELRPGTRYFFVAYANDEYGNVASEPSLTIEDFTSQTVDCNLTPGYWKNHREAWPVNELMLGAVTYTKTQLCDILDNAVRGNGLVSLAHQLIAAKLNVARGNSGMPPSVLASCDDAVQGLIVPPAGDGYLAPNVTSGLTQMLDDFNNGIIWQDTCSPVRTEAKTWGGVKALYR